MVPKLPKGGEVVGTVKAYLESVLGLLKESPVYLMLFGVSGYVLVFTSHYLLGFCGLAICLFFYQAERFNRLQYLFLYFGGLLAGLGIIEKFFRYTDVSRFQEVTSDFALSGFVLVWLFVCAEVEKRRKKQG